MPLLQSRFDALKCCVLVPTYNNEKTLAEVLSGLLEYTTNIIVINDGSTDSTSDIISKFQQIKHAEQHSSNKGKGMALRTGFKKAVELGFEYAITIDSDGQHKPKDLIHFLDKIEQVPGALIIGARNMGQASVPGASSFGNKFSNFWFRVETGIKAPDTQSGYRLYPIKKLNDFTFFTVKYEFEIEVIVRAAWAGIPIEFVAIDVYYPPKEERVSHFRKFPDFTRISILNSILVVLAFAFFRPWAFIRDFKKNNYKDWFRRNVLSSGDSNVKIANTIAFGVFMGLSPFHGIKLIVVITLGIWMRMNKPLLILASYIGMPPLIPFIIFFSQGIGGWILNRPNVLRFSTDMELSVDFVWKNLMQQMVGGTAFAVTGAIIFWFLTLGLLFLVGRKNPVIETTNDE